MFARSFLKFLVFLFREFFTFWIMLVGAILITQSARLLHPLFSGKLGESMRLLCCHHQQRKPLTGIKVLILSPFLFSLGYSIYFTVLISMMDKIPDFIITGSLLFRTRPLSNSALHHQWNSGTVIKCYNDPGELPDYLLRLISWFFSQLIGFYPIFSSGLYADFLLIAAITFISFTYCLWN